MVSTLVNKVDVLTARTSKSPSVFPEDDDLFGNVEPEYISCSTGLSRQVSEVNLATTSTTNDAATNDANTTDNVATSTTNDANTTDNVAASTTNDASTTDSAAARSPAEKPNKNKGKKSRQEQSADNRQRQSVSPEPSGGYRKRNQSRVTLEPMTQEQYKLFHVCIMFL
jgi:hypothetical protein